jgi:acyl-CoA hydrolase
MSFGRIFSLNGCYWNVAAVEVDLTGQVNAETASGVSFGGTGGQGDFVRGAMVAGRGHSIIALPSTVRDGAVNRIVSVLKNVPVTTPRSDADTVVTECGAAELRAQPIDERSRRMIAISHPNFLESLQRVARAFVSPI